MTHISHKEFETLNWLPLTERFNQCINSIVFKYINYQCPNYLNEVVQTAPENNIQTRGSLLKLKCPFRKTKAGQMALSYELNEIKEIEQKINTDDLIYEQKDKTYVFEKFNNKIFWKRNFFLH